VLFQKTNLEMNVSLRNLLLNSIVSQILLRKSNGFRLGPTDKE
jgi:hypothetical protein